MSDLGVLALGACGLCGAVLMFVSDLILYFPSRPSDRSTRIYFERVDPNGAELALSPMQHVADHRLMLGALVGVFAAALYVAGFLHIALVLSADGTVGAAILGGTVASSFTLAMIVGSVYHCNFYYTGALAKAFAKASKDGGGRKDGDGQALVRLLLAKHKEYMLYLYKAAALPGLVGSLALLACIFSSHETVYPRWMAALVPAMSVPLKLLMKKTGCGGLILAGGLTNLWNALFFGASTALVAASSSAVP